MAWDIRSEHVGPVHLPDINILLMKKGDMRDLDLMGREQAERSNDVRIALAKGLIITLRKDPPEAGMGHAAAKAMSDSAAAATAAANAASQLVSLQSETIAKLSTALEGQREQSTQLLAQNEKLVDKMESILSEVQAFAEKYPVEIRTIAEALKNAQAERGVIAEQKKSLMESPSSYTEDEIKTQERILSLKDKKLEKNITALGATISKSASSVQESLDALDTLGFEN